MKKNHVFESSDGTQFESASDCRSYELQQTLVTAMTDLSEAQVLSALGRADVDLADSIERAGSIIAAKRRASGDLKRAKKVYDLSTTEALEKAAEEAK